MICDITKGFQADLGPIFSIECTYTENELNSEEDIFGPVVKVL